ncbi:hypothetical protein SDC9_129707 [bioreactor metagenome]|uniref:Uncharacterized protein n=1 Tax=bioreactor metagenome TaxID=1076179 RepID=A0A645D0L0_9ZZZZ
MDAHIASLANDASAILDAASAYQATADIILEKVDTALQKLYENNVSPSADIIMTVTPRFYMLMKRAYASLDTNNSGIIKNGKVGMYGGITVKMSNNVATASAGAVDKIMVRTKRAIAFVNPMTHVEPYRPEKGFADAVKGFVLYKAKIIRPKEMIVMNVKYTA